MSDARVIVDREDGYNFPTHIACTDLHPDSMME